MLRFSVVIVLLLVCSFSLGESDPLKTPDKMPEPTNTTTTPESPTPKSTTTTTPKPTSTTSTTTTTPRTTTTTSTTTTTPEPPITTATSTPKPSPPPAPTPQQGNWSYTDNNVTCIILQFTAQLNVTYTNNAKLSNALLNIPSNAKVVEGSCSNALQWIKLYWPDKTLKNNVTLKFHSKPAGQSYSLTRVNITLTADEHYFPNSTQDCVSGSGGMSGGAIAAIVIFTLLLLAALH